MNTFLQLLDQGSSKILEPLKRFPLATFFAFVFILMVSIKMSFQFDHSSVNIYDNVMEKIAFIAFFGFFLLLALRLMTKNIFVSLLGVLILVGFYFYLPESLKEHIFRGQKDVTYSLVLVGLLSFIIVAPFIRHRATNREFFEWLKHFLYTILITAIISIVFFSILNIVIEILSGLFEISVDYQYRKYISFFSFVFLAPYLFLSLLTKEPRVLPVKAYNRVEEIFFKYILTGLFIVYFIIIYVYLGKMILLLEYPKGMVSVNIIAFSALALMTYFFWIPLWNEKNSKYKKVIWIAILLQVILLAVALYLRVDAYGWTFGRLVLASLGLWLFALSLYALFKKEISFRGVFLALPVIIILNLLFASNISKGSQQEKLRHLLGSAESFSDESNISLRYNISNTIEYLYGHHGTDALFPLMPEIVSEYESQDDEKLDNCAVTSDKSFPHFTTDKLGFAYISKWQWQDHIHSNKNAERYERKRFHSLGNPVAEGLDLSQYDWIVRFHYRKAGGFSAVLVCEPSNKSNIKQRYSIKTKANEIVIEEEKEVLASINIEDFIKEVIKLASNNKSMHNPFNNDFTQEEFTHLYENDKLKVKLIFDSFGFTLKDELVDYGGLVMIGKK